jgi:hypothetical protein
MAKLVLLALSPVTLIPSVEAVPFVQHLHSFFLASVSHAQSEQDMLKELIHVFAQTTQSMLHSIAELLDKSVVNFSNF